MTQTTVSIEQPPKMERFYSNTDQGSNQITIVPDKPDTTNARLPTRYRTMHEVPPGCASLGNIVFQHGPVEDHGRNGLSEDALVLILIHRIGSHQLGLKPSYWNKKAIEALLLTLTCLERRRLEKTGKDHEAPD